jgi:hypothetical protein
MGNLIAKRDIEKVYPADSYSVIGIAGAAGIAIERGAVHSPACLDSGRSAQRLQLRWGTHLDSDCPRRRLAGRLTPACPLLGANRVS